MLTYNGPSSRTPFDAFFDQLTTPKSSSDVAALDAYRRGDDVWAHIDLPGVAADTIDIDIERNVLTVTAERSWRPQEGDQIYFSERRQGNYRRQLNLGQGLDTENIEADYSDGVLSLRIPVAERAKPRKISVGTHEAASEIEVETTTAA